jgi:acetylornithine deacetylase/succinyl-diaminopimelate desuccinylase-like protein
MNDQAAQNAVAAADAAHDSARGELEALVRIPSISADRDHFPDVRASAEHTAELLRAHGLENVRITGVEDSQPFVLGEWMHAGPGAPTVLLYAHHDVQPPGEVANWASDPFAPEERDGRLYGRGSADDKAGAVAHAHAVGAWLRTAGELPCNVRVLIEGEEEIGSPTLQQFLTSHLDELRADVLVLADSGNWDVGIPALTYALRGLAAADIELRALDSPQHSGMVGGALPDPVMGLATVLASLVDEYGDVAFEGAMAGLRELDEDERAPIPGFDDRTAAFAYSDANAFGAHLKPMFSSDISHFDVPEMSKVMPSAISLLQDGLMTEEQFRDFMFANAVRLHGGANPAFFQGTVVEQEAAAVLAADSLVTT